MFKGNNLSKHMYVYSYVELCRQDVVKSFYLQNIIHDDFIKKGENTHNTHQNFNFEITFGIRNTFLCQITCSHLPHQHPK